MNGTRNGPSRTVLSSLGRDHSSRARNPLERIKSLQNGISEASPRAEVGASESRSRNGSNGRLQSKIVIPQRCDTINGSAKTFSSGRTKQSTGNNIVEREIILGSDIDSRIPHGRRGGDHSLESPRSRRRSPGNGKESQSSEYQRKARGFDAGNRHELAAWKRATASTAQRPDKHKRPLPSPSGQSTATRTGSSLSKRSEASTNNSLSASSRSSLKAERFVVKAKSRSSSKSRSESGGGSTRKLVKVIQKPSVTKRKDGNDGMDASTSGTTAKVASQASGLKRWTSFGCWKLECSSTNGREYYYNTETKKSTWYKPQEWMDAEQAAAEASNASATQGSMSVPLDAAVSNKRKPSEIELLDNPKSSKISRTVIPATDGSLLGSPISDDNDDRLSAASPTPSERMDISDAEAASNASVAASRNAITTSSKTSTTLRRKASDHLPSVSGKKGSSSATKKTKAPTLEDLKKMEENDDPDKRRTLKLERVKEWRSQLGGTPTEVSQSPVDIAGSPVSSETSTASPQWSRPSNGPATDLVGTVKQESLVIEAKPSDLPTGPVHVSTSACSRIVLPAFDLPELPDSASDIPQLFVEPLTAGFSSMKIAHVENLKCKNLFDVRSSIYSGNGEKVVQMKSNLSDILQRKMTTLSQAEDISFLSTLQDELSHSVHSRSDVARPFPLLKLESPDADMKSDLSSLLVDSKPLLIRVTAEDRCLLTSNGLTT